MIWSFVYLGICRVMEPLLLLFRSRDAKEVEILILRRELEVLRRQHPRPRLEPKDRALLAALSRLLPRRRWSLLVVTPATLVGWHRRMDRRHRTYPNNPKGRPPVSAEIQALIVACNREPTLGLRAHQGRAQRPRLPSVGLLGPSHPTGRRHRPSSSPGVEDLAVLGCPTGRGHGGV